MLCVERYQILEGQNPAAFKEDRDKKKRKTLQRSRKKVLWEDSFRGPACSWYHNNNANNTATGTTIREDNRWMRNAWQGAQWQRKNIKIHFVIASKKIIYKNKIRNRGKVNFLQFNKKQEISLEVPKLDIWIIWVSGEENKWNKTTLMDVIEEKFLNLEEILAYTVFYTVYKTTIVQWKPTNIALSFSTSPHLQIHALLESNLFLATFSLSF